MSTAVIGKVIYQKSVASQVQKKICNLGSEGDIFTFYTQSGSENFKKSKQKKLVKSNKSRIFFSLNYIFGSFKKEKGPNSTFLVIISFNLFSAENS